MASTTRRRYSLGLDFGTGSARALLVDVETGHDAGSGAADYRHGEGGVVSDPGDPHLARQHPGDWDEAMRGAVREALEDAPSRDPGFSPERVIGLGIDATASTPVPVDAGLRPLALEDRFAGEPAALAWLWKDHTSWAEAEELTDLLRRHSPAHLERVGGACSSEWYLPKLLRLARTAPGVFEAMEGWVELGDWIAARLTGTVSPGDVVRGSCAAGHKALVHDALGPPGPKVLGRLHDGLGAWLASRGAPRTAAGGTCVGRLAPGPARALGLVPGIAVSAPGIDAHVGAVGAGVRPGVMVKILGTSSCDMLVHPAGESPPPEIPGVSGVVRDSVLPGHWGVEAGQAAVGDLYAWFVREFGEPMGLDHDALTERAAAMRPGASGLVALDWNHGNRSLLGDPRLTGLLVGQTLSTRPHEIYRALIEATAFGARRIVDRLVECGLAVEELVFCGGIAEKNPWLLDIYADVLERPVELSRSDETCALGAAILGAVAAGPGDGGPASVAQAVERMTGRKEGRHTPDAERAAVYRELDAIYGALHDAFRRDARPVDLSRVMKRLLELRAG